ncbi:hypothetical protein Mgra_00006897, partial [Meloidogyne graminicola]
MVEGNLPTSEETDKFCFYIPEETGVKSCVTAVTTNLLATFRHGPHESLRLNDTVKVISNVNSTSFNTIVRSISEDVDCVILKCEDKVVDRGPRISTLVRRGQPLILIGRGNNDGRVGNIKGNVYEDFGQFISY